MMHPGVYRSTWLRDCRAPTQKASTTDPFDDSRETALDCRPRYFRGAASKVASKTGEKFL
jgi:hypothetical protein